MLFPAWLSWTAHWPRLPTFSLLREVTEMPLKNAFVVHAKKRYFWLAQQSFLFAWLWFHRMPRCPFPVGIPGNVSSPLGFSHQTCEANCLTWCTLTFWKLVTKSVTRRCSRGSVVTYGDRASITIDQNPTGKQKGRGLSGQFSSQ